MFLLCVLLCRVVLSIACVWRVVFPCSFVCVFRVVLCLNVYALCCYCCARVFVFVCVFVVMCCLCVVGCLLFCLHVLRLVFGFLFDYRACGCFVLSFRLRALCCVALCGYVLLIVFFVLWYLSMGCAWRVFFLLGFVDVCVSCRFVFGVRCCC